MKKKGTVKIVIKKLCQKHQLCGWLFPDVKGIQPMPHEFAVSKYQVSTTPYKCQHGSVIQYF